MAIWVLGSGTPGGGAGDVMTLLFFCHHLIIRQEQVSPVQTPPPTLSDLTDTDVFKFIISWQVELELELERSDGTLHCLLT